MNAPAPKLPVNTWDQVGHGGVFVSYVRASGGRGVRPPAAQVVRPGFKTDPNAAWYDNGCKTFVGRMAHSVPQAKAWAEARYGIKRWRRNGAGDWVDADKVYPPLRSEVERAAARAAKKAAKQGAAA